LVLWVQSGLGLAMRVVESVLDEPIELDVAGVAWFPAMSTVSTVSLCVPTVSPVRVVFLAGNGFVSIQVYD